MPIARFANNISFGRIQPLLKIKEETLIFHVRINYSLTKLKKNHSHLLRNSNAITITTETKT